MRSMTAYSLVRKRRGAYTSQVILRSTNFKYLDTVVHNLPAEDILLGEKIKRRIKKAIYRGKVEAFIFCARCQAKGIKVDEKAIANYITQIRKLIKKYNLDPQINIGDILSLPDVVDCQQRSGVDENFILSVAKTALHKLIQFKKKEGAVIRAEMNSNLKKIESNITNIKKYKPKAKDRQDSKEDIDEELSLASFYVSKLKTKVNSKKFELKGKAIDFLTQEILRELNAASSKTRKKTLAILIVEAKNYLERIREQTQNIE